MIRIQSSTGEQAKRRAYYTKIGFPEMSQFYFHHSEEELRGKGYKKISSGLFQRKGPLSWWVLK
jgi:hypothetical protein